MWTKGYPKDLTRRHVPISILLGAPMHPGVGDDCEVGTAELRSRLSELLDRAQADYPESPVASERWWLPAHLGGTAPTPEDAAALDARPAVRD